jgi:hypothetical protein
MRSIRYSDGVTASGHKTQLGPRFQAPTELEEALARESHRYWVEVEVLKARAV